MVGSFFGLGFGWILENPDGLFFVFVVFFVRSVGVATVLFPVQRRGSPYQPTNQSLGLREVGPATNQSE